MIRAGYYEAHDMTNNISARFAIGGYYYPTQGIIRSNSSADSLSKAADFSAKIVITISTYALFVTFRQVAMSVKFLA